MSFRINSLNAFNYNSYSSFFTTNSNSASQSNSLFSSLGDYASIRNGSYAKLVKNYYAKYGTDNKTDSKSDSTNKTDEATTSKTEMSKLKSLASDLSEAATALYTDKSLFEKKDITTKDENGLETTTKDYDREAISKAVNSYVDAYNSYIDKAGDSEDKSILSTTLNTIKRTSANEKLLSKVGITVGKDNKLTVDKDKLNEASAGDLKSLFGSVGSYGYYVGSNSSATVNYASGKLSGSSLYTSSATKYSQITASNFIDYI